MQGTAEALSTVSLFTNAACSGSPAAAGTAAAFASPGFTLPVPDDSATTVSAFVTDENGNPGPCSAARTYTEDSTALPPSLTATDPSSPANSNAPRVQGIAEAGSQVQLFGNSACVGAPIGVGSAAELAGAGIQVPAPDNFNSDFHGKIVDVAGNTSACGAGLAYTEDSTALPPTLDAIQPDGPANNNAPKVKGSAEAGSQVQLFGNSACSGAPIGAGTAADLAGAGIALAVPDNATTSVFGRIVDTAGNDVRLRPGAAIHRGLQGPGERRSRPRRRRRPPSARRS